MLAPGTVDPANRVWSRRLSLKRLSAHISPSGGLKRNFHFDPKNGYDCSPIPPVPVNMKQLSSGSPEVCDNRYYDVRNKYYVYLPAWVDFLAGKLGEAATYDLSVHGVSPVPPAP